MKNQLAVIIALCIVIPSVALSATDDVRANNRTKVLQSPISDSGNTISAIQPTSPDRTSERLEKPEDYEGVMVAISQKFSATLATIAEAVQQGKISSEQAKELSAEQYQLIHIQFQLLSLWREIDEEKVAQTPNPQESPAPTQDGDIVTVALPFSSFQLSPSLSEYLSLTPSQVAAIQQVMTREQKSLQPLMAQMRITREKLLAIGSDRINEKEVKGLAQDEATLLARLIVANARLQSKIYKVLSPAQQRRLNNLEQTQGASTPKDNQ